MNVTNGHPDRGQQIDEGVARDLEYANSSSRFHAVVAEAQSNEAAAIERAADSRRIADERWPELEEIRARVAEGREALAQSAAHGPTKPLAKVLKFFEGKGTSAEDLDTAERTCQIFEDEARKLALAATDATEQRVSAERKLSDNTKEQFRAVTSRRFEAMRPLIAGCGSPGGDLLPLITPNGDDWVSWTQQNVYIGGSDREDALDELNAILAEDATP